jgi:imidazolonepropionase-like amidohydrolase
MNPKLERRLAACVALATHGAWKVGSVTRERAALLLALEGSAGSITLEIRSAEAGRPSYRTIGAHAFSYRGNPGPFSGQRRRMLDATIVALSVVLARTPPELLVSAAAADEPPAGFPTPYHRHHLESELSIPPAAIEAFRRDGHVLLRGALARDVVLAARPLLLAALQRSWPKEALPLEERRDAYSQAFVQVTNVGLDDEAIRAFTHSRRLGKMAAELMGVNGTRIYCEDWLIKEPGARITPWHQDAAVYSMHAEAALTIWIPIQDVPPGMGLVRFARGSHRFGVFPVENINDVSEETFSRIIDAHGFAIDECRPLRMGDVSFHDGYMIHAAHPNDSPELRVVLALHCFADGAVVKTPETAAMARQLADFAPELRPGDTAACRKWPLIYSSKDPLVGRFLSTGAGPAYHLRATLLPGGDEPVDVWIQDGRFRTTPVAGARELQPAGGFAIAGLVDAHSHVSWPHDRDTPADTPAFMDQNRANQAATGVTLLRDMGSAGDAILALGDRPGLPRVHASGMLVLRYDGFPFTPTPPDALRRVFLERIERGARWVKVFSDWSSDFGGKENTGFTGHDELTYPLPVLADAVAAVHEAGGRVGAHCFTRAGVEVAILAGCDSLEHGWGVDASLVEEMAARGVAWVPLLGIATAMWRTACRDNEPERATWIEAAMESLATLLPLAHRRGVPIFAGTDWFPEVTVADEVRALHSRGLSIETALAAGSWAARAWLGEPGIEDGAPADLVVYHSDPRRSLEVIEQPALILIGGRRVDPAAAHIRPRRLVWAERTAAL